MMKYEKLVKCDNLRLKLNEINFRNSNASNLYLYSMVGLYFFTLISFSILDFTLCRWRQITVNFTGIRFVNFYIDFYFGLCEEYSPNSLFMKELKWIHAEEEK